MRHVHVPYKNKTRGIIIAYFRNSAVLVVDRINKHKKFDVVALQSEVTEEN
jgi:hypothetical protein